MNRCSANRRRISGPARTRRRSPRRTCLEAGRAAAGRHLRLVGLEIRSGGCGPSRPGRRAAGLRPQRAARRSPRSAATSHRRRRRRGLGPRSSGADVADVARREQQLVDPAHPGRAATPRPTPGQPPRVGSAARVRLSRSSTCVDLVLGDEALLDHEGADALAGRGRLLHQLGHPLVAEERVERGGGLRGGLGVGAAPLDVGLDAGDAAVGEEPGRPTPAAGSTRAGCGRSPAGTR